MQSLSNVKPKGKYLLTYTNILFFSHCSISFTSFIFDQLNHVTQNHVLDVGLLQIKLLIFLFCHRVVAGLECQQMLVSCFPIAIILCCNK